MTIGEGWSERWVFTFLLSQFFWGGRRG